MSGCQRVYYGGTGRGLYTRIREHRGDIRNHRLSNAFVIHVEEEGHLPDWSAATCTDCKLSKAQRKVIEAAFIAMGGTLNMSTGFFRLASAAASLVRQGFDL